MSSEHPLEMRQIGKVPAQHMPEYMRHIAARDTARRQSDMADAQSRHPSVRGTSKAKTFRESALLHTVKGAQAHQAARNLATPTTEMGGRREHFDSGVANREWN